jgi:hydrogenase maturation protease
MNASASQRRRASDQREGECGCPAPASARRRRGTLIVGIGNPLRGDDGLGWAVAEQLSRNSQPGYAIHTVYQLTPELAQQMADARLVVMIDASHEGVPGELRIRALPTSAQPSAVGTHYSTPEELAALTTALYGHCPPVVVVSMTGADFSLREQFSEIVAQQLPLLCAAVREVCAGGG